jgi:peptidoglycan/LPS O-acetylase OafA/YrhL
VNSQKNARVKALTNLRPQGVRRMLQIDVLRGVAIVMVLLHHADTIIPPERSGFLKPLAHFGRVYGWTGVDLFFVLSGFLIGGLLFQEIKRRDSLSIKRFIFRRGFKIWPSYYLWVLYWIVHPILKNHENPIRAIRDMAPNLLHIQNYTYMPHEHTWSLSAEEHFYLALPLLLGWLLSRARQPRAALKALPGICAGLSVICTALRAVTAAVHPYTAAEGIKWGWHVLTPTHLRMDALMFGVFLAYMHHFEPEKLQWIKDRRSARVALFTGGLALTSVILFLDRYTAIGASLGLLCVYIGFGGILLACLYNNRADGSPALVFANPLGRVVAWIGFYSYAIYLWHIDQARDRAVHMEYVHKFAGRPDGIRYLLIVGFYMVFAILFGAIFTRLIEMPVLKIRDRLYPDLSGRQ